VGAFGLEGVVQALHDREAEVDVRGKRLRARVDELHIVSPASAGEPRPARVRVSVELQPREGSLTELNVIGCSVEEALTRTEKFLDEALLGELRTVRLIHGYGTGQLRRAIAGFLQTQPFVTSFSAAPPEQGGGGVTVVELKEKRWRCFPQASLTTSSRAPISCRSCRSACRSSSGVTWKGLCPFHGEKNTSFHVNSDKGLFHCFGCGVGGDVIEFVKLYDKIAFPDACGSSHLGWV
jgi:hypothetical protein